MFNPNFIIDVLLIPFVILLIKWSRDMNRYRDLYQNKISPKIPISNKAVMEEFQKDPISTYGNIISGKTTVSLIKMLFGKVDDQELKKAQLKTRHALFYVLIYMVIWVFIGAIILHFSN